MWHLIGGRIRQLAIATGFSMCVLAPVASAAGGLPELQSLLAGAAWEAKAPGIERLAVPQALSGVFSAYRLAQDKVTARVLGQLEASGSPVGDVAAHSGASLTINGGYFWIKPDGALAPTGLLVTGGVRQAPLNKCRACTALLITDGKGLHITRPSAFKSKRGIESALQAGPMLVDGGRLMAFNPDGPAAARTAICLSGASIIAVVSLREITLAELASMLLARRADGGFDCTQAINLDGGSSSQLLANLPGGQERLGLPRPVQNMIGFFPR